MVYPHHCLRCFQHLLACLATGVIDGALMRGVPFFGEGTRTSSVIMTLRTDKVWFTDSIHLETGPDVKVRFA